MKDRNKTKSQLMEELEVLRRHLGEFKGVSSGHTPETPGIEVSPQFSGLYKALRRLKPNDHLCLIYESPEEWRAAVIPFITAGLDGGEKCIYILGTHTADRIRTCLQEEGVNVADAEASGKLLILYHTDVQARGGPVDRHRLIALLTAEVDKAIDKGYRRIRVTEEIEEHLDSEKLLEYEAKLNRDFFPRYPCVGICQYDRWKSDPEVIKNAIMTHPLLVRNSQIYRNFYYIPPEEFLSRKRDEREVQDMLASIEQEGKTQKRVRFLSNVLEFSSQPFSSSYPDGRIMYCNPALSALTGYTEKELRTMTWAVDLTPPEWREMEREMLWELHRTGQPQVYEEEVICKDGSRVPIEVFNHEVRDDGGNIQYYYRFVTNITERKRVEKVLSNKVEDLEESRLVLKEKMEEINRQRLAILNMIEDIENSKQRLESVNIRLRNEITERKKAEEGLRESEEKSRVILHTMPSGLFTVDPNRRIISWNKEAEQITGLKAEEVIGKDCLEVFDCSACRKGCVLFDEEIDKPAYGKECVAHIEGRDIAISKNAEMLRDGKGNIIGGVESFVDVTERMRTEEMLREERDRAQKYLDVAGVMFIVLDKKGNVVLVNRKACEILGREEREIVSKNWFNNFVPERVRNEVKGVFRKLMAGKIEPAEYFENPVVTKRGEERLVWWHNTVLRDREGRITSVLASGEDITERKRVEEVLRESEERVRIIFNTTKDCIFVKDSTLRYTHVNPATERLFGLPASELVGLTDEELFGGKAAAHIREVDARVLNGETVEEEHTKPVDGTPITFHIIKMPLHDESGEIVGLCGIARDITDRKKTEEALREERDNAILMLRELRS